MAFPVIQSTAATSTTSTSAALSITMPASVAVGDLLVVIIARRNAAQTFTFPAGWAALSGADGVVNSVLQVHVYWKIADGTEGASIAVTSTITTSQRVNAYALRIDGHDATNPLYTGTPSLPGGVANPNPPNCAPGVGALDFLWLAYYYVDNASGSTFSSYPTNYSLYQYNAEGAATSTGTEIGFAGRELNASSEDPGTFGTSGNIPNYANTLAIRPAVALADVFNWGMIID